MEHVGKYRCNLSNIPCNTGVSSVETDVAAKTVVVEADPSVSPQLMLEKLQKVRLNGVNGNDENGTNFCIDSGAPRAAKVWNSLDRKLHAVD